MAKICAFCGEEIGVLSRRAKLRNGYICKNCLKSAGIDHFPLAGEHSIEEFQPYFSERTALVKAFSPDRLGGTEKLKIDMRNQLFELCGNLYRFSDLVGYHQNEERQTHTTTNERGGGGAAIGAMIGAAVLAPPRRVTRSGRIKTSLVGRAAGAAIGGAIASSLDRRREETIITEEVQLTIDIILHSEVAKEETLEYDLDDSDERKQGMRTADTLEQITRANKAAPQNRVASPNRAVTRVTSTPDPVVDDPLKMIERYYDLYKRGAISIEEYTAKKNELLGLTVPAVQPPRPVNAVTEPVKRNGMQVARPMINNDGAMVSPKREQGQIHAAAAANSRIPVPRMSYVVQQGQKTSIGLKRNNRERIFACVGWNVSDPTVQVGLTVSAKGIDGRTITPCPGIQDQKGASGDRTDICIDFSQLPGTVERISFALTLSSLSQSGATGNGMEIGWIRILRNDRYEILSFRITEFPPNMTEFVLGELYINREEWKFNPVGRGLRER